MRRALPLVLAIVLFFAAGVLWIASDRRAARRAFDKYSSANTSETGLSLARGYLRKGGRVEVLTRPIGRQKLVANAVVFRVAHDIPRMFDPDEFNIIGPKRPRISPLLSDDEETFVRGGGRLVIAAAENFLATRQPAENVARRVFPSWPDVNQLAMPEPRGFLHPAPRAVTLFATTDAAVVTRERIGAGDLVLIAVPEIFQNQHLVSGDHLGLLVALAANRPVYFDEVVHGIVSDDGALALMKEWNLGPFLMLLMIVAALIFWRNGRRIGPPEEDFRDTRSDAVDLVQSLGALYADVTNESQALALYRDSLTRTVALQTGLRGDALKTRVADLTGHEDSLDAINNAFRKLERGGIDAHHR